MLGYVCFEIAYKYEENQQGPYILQALASITNNEFPLDEVAEMEKYVLQVLKHEMGFVSTFDFLISLAKKDKLTKESEMKTFKAALYLFDFALLDHRFLAYPTSYLAAACYYAFKKEFRHEKNLEQKKYNGYTAQTVSKLSSLILASLQADKDYGTPLLEILHDLRPES